MSKAIFNVTYEVITADSAEYGEAEAQGFVETGMRLRDAVGALRGTRTNAMDGVQGIECDSSPCVRPRWITIYNGMEFETGEYENRSLHIPEGVTAASARRIARLCGAKVSTPH